MRLSLTLAAALVSTGFATMAVAADEPFETVPEASSFSLLVGIGASVQPIYEGSDEYRISPFPIIAPSFGPSDGPRRFEFRSLDDIRVHAIYFGNLSIGPLAGYRFGRDEDDAARLRGTGDVDGGLVVGGFVNYDFIAEDATRLGLDVSIASQVTGDVFDGTAFDRGTDYGIEVGTALSLDHQVNDALRVSGRLGAIFADDDYMRTGFGISPAQAAASTLPVFDADAGLKNVYLNVGATYNVTERFELRAGAGYSWLVGDAADSPITTDADQFSGYLGAAYRFRF